MSMIRWLMPRGTRPASLVTVLAGALLLVAQAHAAAPRELRAQEGDRGRTTAEILERFDRAQQETTTLVAGFTEEKKLQVLARPLVSRGRFYYNRPNQVRWEYEDPERRVFVITENSYTAYFPAEKRAENVEIKQFVGKRLFRFLAVGQSIRELAKYYDVARVTNGSLEGAHLLVLTPGRRRVRERLAALRIWIDAGTFLPRRIAYEEPDGDSTVLTFHDPRANVELAARQFRVDLPPDVMVSSSFNGLSLAQGGR
jgi:outer membrane lipoprotein carrier protein